MLTNAQQTVKASLGTTFGDMLHEGRYYDPLLTDIRAFLDSSQERVTGDVRVRLHKGNIVPLGTRSPYSLLDAGRRLGSTYGHGSSLWTGDEARAFAHIYATAGVLAQVNRRRPVLGGEDRHQQRLEALELGDGDRLGDLVGVTAAAGQGHDVGARRQVVGLERGLALLQDDAAAPSTRAAAACTSARARESSACGNGGTIRSRSRIHS